MSASEPSDMHRIPDAVSPGPSPKLGRGLFHPRLGIELIADDEIGRGLAFAALIPAGG
jgi:hypothetical protein